MYKIWISLLCICCGTLTITHAQTEIQTVARFFAFLNTYQKDSLENIITDDFQIKRTFTNYITQRADFLSSYLTFSQNLEASFTILTADSTQNPIIVEVEDNSIIIQYMQLKKPIWKMSIFTEENKVSSILIDTTINSKLYLQQVKEANEAFVIWLKRHYPSETMEDLYPQKAVLIKRITEFMEDLE